MPERLDIVFAPISAPLEPAAAVLCEEEIVLGGLAKKLNTASGGALLHAAEAAGFKGKARTAIELLGQAKLAPRLIVVGTGRAAELTEADWVNLGGYAFGQLSARKAESASLVAEVQDSGQRAAGAIAADMAFGALLRSYNFRKYVTRKAENEEGAPPPDGIQKLLVHTAEPDAARVRFERHQAVAAGVFLARDLVNEPANALGPVEFADRMRDLTSAGVEIEVLEEDALKALKMGALLGVAQGSARPPRVVIMQWNGAKSRRARPLAFIGKGVCFDTGGISMKPAQGMEDMKGDMAGAACVAGLMLALASRKAAVNAVGLIGLVENMPSATAQRPGDIVTSMSGQTVEVLNTDAEGRLVLADVMWYAQERFKPRLMIDLATLTGAIMVALGKEYAGLFSNDDRLAADLVAAGQATGERVWRMPLDRAYDKMIDSKNADVKNIGGRHAGAITAAQFLGRFVKGTTWAHIDVAGVAMDSSKTEINRSWASGWGVRLLDHFVSAQHEKPDR
ncbi:MAG TPA: leucyl aminopeptidase [Hyphomicrobiaceae bacterium]|nr:leucyl aminopeptidase [Hyphomicrobiaceae bacterium]